MENTLSCVRRTPRIHKTQHANLPISYVPFFAYLSLEYTVELESAYRLSIRDYKRRL